MFAVNLDRTRPPTAWKPSRRQVEAAGYVDEVSRCADEAVGEELRSEEVAAHAHSSWWRTEAACCRLLMPLESRHARSSGNS